MSQLPISPRLDSVVLAAKDNGEDIEYEELELGLSAPTDTPPTPSLCGVPLKYISLVTLAVQNSLLTIIMHYSRVSIPPSQSYSAPTAVLFNELLKGSISLVIAFTQIDRSASSSYTSDTPQLSLITGRFWNPAKVLLRVRRLGREVFSPDCWKLSIPAILYVIQNNLQYVAATNLEAATFQVSYQMKILTTAAFSVLLLRKQLSANQWLALFFLAIGVGIVQIQTGASDTAKAASSLLFQGTSMNALKGFLAVVAACFTSGLAGVYFEMVLKNSQTDLWIRNVQLSAFSLLPALVPIVLTRPSESGLINSLFQNFGAWAWATVAIQVIGGLVTAMVIKYSDNILKGFATSLSIVISFLASVALFDFQITFTFILGSVIVLIATWLYNQPGRSSSTSRLGYSVVKT
ncbi:nucleotide-sugar transporter [Paxillus ammoniavirescens]|nr:nucleotide-sugar transporter [Paxillus ammoniavirescens]